ncbi:hypothetical protein HDU92_000695 [Lobulomyces angularis]|nr:hypothetical protein HDU92_000695 [Lobulomyces angularis]
MLLSAYGNIKRNVGKEVLPLPLKGNLKDGSTYEIIKLENSDHSSLQTLHNTFNKIIEEALLKLI